MSQNPRTVLHEFLEGVQEFFAAYGWPILLSLIAIYYFQDNINNFREHLSLRRAQNPARVQILEAERKRIRLKQQMEANKALLEAKEREGSMPATDTKKPEPKKSRLPPPSTPSSSGFNPLGGGGNIQTFKPSGGGMRNRRRG